MLQIQNNLYKYNSLSNLQKNNKVSFGENEVHLWLDNNGTYCPEKSKGITPDNDRLKSYFKKISKFLRSNRNTVHLGIITGRNRGEFKTNVRQIKDAGIDYELPQRISVKGGGDNYVNPIQNIKEFCKTGMNSALIDKTKLDEIKRKTDWDPDYIRSTIIKTLDQDFDLPVILAPSIEKDFDNDVLKSVANNRNQKIAFVRQDGDLQFFIGLPKGSKAIEKNTALAHNLKKKFQSEKPEMQYVIEFAGENRGNAGGPMIIIAPRTHGDTNLVVDVDKEGWNKTYDKKPDKSFDTAREINRAMENNDLVILAGNGSNDSKMLDPKTYESMKKDGQELPFMSIAIGDNSKLNALEKKTPEKFVKIDSAYDLLDGIKQAIAKFSSRTPIFKPEIKN